MSAASPLHAMLPDPFGDEIARLHAIRDELEAADDETRAKFAAADPDLASDWVVTARRAQLPPLDLGPTWLFLAGRGAGKTRAMCQAAHIAVRAGIRKIHIISPTAADVRDVMIEGDSGLIAAAPPGMRPRWIETKRRLEWPPPWSARAICFSAEEPDSLRGPECELLIIDELGRMIRAAEVYETALLGLRKGAFPRLLIATTPPKPTMPSGTHKLIKTLARSPSVSLTRGSTFENEAHLSARYVADLREFREGSTFALREIHGQIIDDVSQEVFREEWVGRAPILDEEIVQSTVGVDPSGAVTGETGIVVAARLADGSFGVLADRSCRGTLGSVGRSGRAQPRRVSLRRCRRRNQLWRRHVH